MPAARRSRAAVKFLFWTLISIWLILVVARAHTSGQMAAWFYHQAAIDGFAIDANSFAEASREQPVLLQVGRLDRIEGKVAVPVKKGDRLPANSNGVIGNEVLEKGVRASLEGETLRVMVPWEIQQSKGFKYKDTFKHKGVRTYPWAGVWNVAVTLGLGLALGFMAEGFTDLLGIKLEKIRHFEGH